MTASSSTPKPREAPPNRLSSTILALVLPTAVAATSALIAWSWRDDLPDPIATHWGSDGPDRFSTLTSALITTPLISVAISAVLWATAFWWGWSASTRRMANAFSLGISILLYGVLLGSLDAQRGLADAAKVGGIGPVIGIAAIAGIAFGVLVGILTPGDAHRPAATPPPPSAARLPLATNERAVWLRDATGGPGLLIGLLAVSVSIPAVAIFGSFWMLVIPAALLTLLLAMFRWKIRVDANGLTVRSALGFPRTHLALDEIVEANTTTVHCLRDYGGWGWRTGRAGQVGIVVRSGEALEVQRTGGRKFVITVDDSATAAALLNSLADRNRAA